MTIIQRSGRRALSFSTSRVQGKYLLLFLISFSLLFALPSPVGAEGGITLVSSKVISQFPDGILFQVEASSDQEITDITVRFRRGTSVNTSYDYLDFEKSTTVNGELLFRTDTSSRYMPPGTPITYHFEIEDAGDQKLTTEPETIVYFDTRFEWEEVSRGPITIAYHGPVKTRAELLLDAMMETMDNMGPLLGAELDLTDPIRVSMYNNAIEMLQALPPRSQTIRNELITEGMAFANIGHLLVLGSGTLAKGTVSHELTHILVDRAADNPFRAIPSWLNEGLAEYGNVDPGFSYDVALEFAVATNRILPIIFLNALPGTPEDIIIFYGEAKSIVEFLIDKFGDDKLREFLATFKSGKSIDDSLREVYGFDRLGLDRQWRDSIGALPYIPPTEGGGYIPTPVPYPTFLPYSLTPQPASATATPEPTPQPTPTNTPEVTSVPEPTPEEAGGGGSGCNEPLVTGKRAALDPSAIAMLVGLIGLGFMSRRKR